MNLWRAFQFQKKNRKLFVDLHDKLQRIHEESNVHIDSNVYEEIAESYECMISEFFTEEEIKILYHAAIQYDLGILKITEEDDNAIVDNNNEREGNFYGKSDL